jgi:5-(carboxyamino)imidazole ribonucleotide synthase
VKFALQSLKMADTFYKGFTLGILGGGQLGRMLIQPCINYNIKTAVLDPDPEAPCKGVASEFVLGSFKDYDTVLKFGQTVDLITIEIEHVNVEALEELQRQGKTVYPQPEVIRIVQDKGLQKQFYKDNHIPTADFVLVDHESALPEYLHFLPAFQKSRTAGYDGKGVKGLFMPEDLEEALTGPSLLERKVDHDKEIAVIVSRNSKGEVSVYPAVELVFHPEKNLLNYLASPAAISDMVAEKAADIARTLIKKLNMVGLLAVEMFVTLDGEVLVNEIAPRPHNSGHQSIEANITSQYEQHLRAILGMPAGATDTLSPSIMVNLLGEPGYEGEAIYEGLDDVLRLSGVHVHLYGKAITKPYRKMGHITITGKDWESVQQKAKEVLDKFKIIA